MHTRIPIYALTLFLFVTSCANAPEARTPGAAAPTLAPGVTAPRVTPDAIPETLGALKLVRSMQGTEALREFSGLHNNEFPLTGGYRADYSDGAHTATLWVAQTSDSAAAAALTNDMAKKISAGNAMFQNLQALSINGRQLFVADGQGQQHYFFANGNRVVWLATDPPLAARALHELWNVK